MDAQTLGAYAGYVAILISIGGMIVTVCNHKRLRSTCCGREATVSLDIGSITPPEQKPTVTV